MFYKGTSKARTTQLADNLTATASDHIRGVGYVRVSMDMQALEGVSLDAQSEKIKAYCKPHDVELIGIYKDEGLSAKSLERPGLKSALAKLERGKANTLLVVKLDRLTRSLLDLDMLIRGWPKRCEFAIVGSEPAMTTPNKSRRSKAPSCSDRLKVVACQSRLAVLRLLMTKGPHTVLEIGRKLKIEQTLLSHHLQVLRAAELVKAVRMGKAMRYELHGTQGGAKAESSIELGCCAISFKS